MKDTVLACLAVFLLYVIATALLVVPITLAVVFSWWWLLLYAATVPIFMLGRLLITIY